MLTNSQVMKRILAYNYIKQLTRRKFIFLGPTCITYRELSNPMYFIFLLNLLFIKVLNLNHYALFVLKLAVIPFFFFFSDNEKSLQLNWKYALRAQELVRASIYSSKYNCLDCHFSPKIFMFFVNIFPITFISHIY